MSDHSDRMRSSLLLFIHMFAHKIKIEMGGIMMRDRMI